MKLNKEYTMPLWLWILVITALIADIVALGLVIFK